MLTVAVLILAFVAVGNFVAGAQRACREMELVKGDLARSQPMTRAEARAMTPERKGRK